MTELIVPIPTIPEKVYMLANNYGYLRSGEVDALSAVVRTLPPNPTIINLGSGVGTSGLLFAAIRPDARVVTVDHCLESPFGGLYNETNAFMGTPYKRPEQMFGETDKVGLAWGMPVDMVMIDADHSEEAARKDLLAWYPHVKEGGVIAFHDYEPKFPGVVKVVDEEMCGQEQVVYIDTVKAFRVNKDVWDTVHSDQCRYSALFGAECEVSSEALA